MQPENWEVLVLKPTPAFLSFLSQQFPLASLPELQLLQTDNTGYLICKQYSDEELLDEIENHYIKMFKHEIKRWVSDDEIMQEVGASFLDFLCCFKFEMHAHIMLLEEHVLDGKQMICVKPRRTMTRWLEEKLMEDVDGMQTVVDTPIDTSQWMEGSTVVIKNLDNVYDLKPFLKLHYDALYESEMTRMCDGLLEWPEIDSYQMFCRYFVVEYHSQLIHLN